MTGGAHFTASAERHGETKDLGCLNTQEGGVQPERAETGSGDLWVFGWISIRSISLFSELVMTGLIIP